MTKRRHLSNSLRKYSKSKWESKVNSTIIKWIDVIESVKAIKLKGDNSIRNTNFSRSVINPNQRNSEKRHYEAKSEVKMRMAKTIGEYK